MLETNQQHAKLDSLQTRTVLPPGSGQFSPDAPGKRACVGLPHLETGGSPEPPQRTLPCGCKYQTRRRDGLTIFVAAEYCSRHGA